ncbi:MAG: hypothetical protein QGF00_29640 [Planctomycetota bacterium]|jgi:hypothetical protein|nr:hypothetical protein [Planctomycetota bacterium]
MNGYERALRTLRFEETDCVATFGGWVVSAGFFEYVTGRRFWDAPRSVAFEAYRKLELDILFQGIYLPESQEDWRKHTTEVLDGAEKFTTVEAVIDYVESLPDPLTLEADFDFEGQLETTLDGYEKTQDEIGGDIFCLPACGNVRFTWYSVFGYSSYLSAIGLYPDTMKKLFEHSAEVARLGNLVRAELVKQKKLQPFFFTGQDICGQRGPMISPEALRALYFPNLRHALQPLVDIGAKIIWHSDGYIIPLVDDLIACGISGFQGFQEETGFDVRDMASLRVGSGRKPILLAGLSVARVLPYGSVADVERDVERIVDAAGEGGGLVIGTANTAGPDCPNENLAALYRHPHACSAGAVQV